MFFLSACVKSLIARVFWRRGSFLRTRVHRDGQTDTWTCSTEHLTNDRWRWTCLKWILFPSNCDTKGSFPPRLCFFLHGWSITIVFLDVFPGPAEMQQQWKAVEGREVSVEWNPDVRHTCAKPPHLCPTPCDPEDCSPPGPSVPGTLQAGILARVAVPSSGGSSWHRAGTHTSCTGRRSLYLQHLLGSPEAPSANPQLSGASVDDVWVSRSHPFDHILFRLQLWRPFPTDLSLRQSSFNCALTASVKSAAGLTREPQACVQASQHVPAGRVWPDSPQAALNRPRAALNHGRWELEGKRSPSSLCLDGVGRPGSLTLRGPQEMKLPSPQHLTLAFPPSPFHLAFLLLPSFTHLHVLAQILLWGWTQLRFIFKI